MEKSLGYLGTIGSSYPINAVYQWMRGPEDAVVWVALEAGQRHPIEQFKETLRGKLAAAIPGVQFSFEPADIINEVMSFGSPTPVEVAVNGPDFAETRPYAAKLMEELAALPGDPRPATRAVARLPDGPGGRGPQESGVGLCHSQRRGEVAGRGHFFQPLHGAQLTGPIPRPASATRCRWKCRAPSSARRRGSSPWVRSPT